MKKQTNEIDKLVPVIKGIANHFGEKCEVVLHDYSQPFEKTIVAIENGHVTNRKVGDGSTNYALEAMQKPSEVKDKYAYYSQTSDGKIIKSSTIYIRNADNDIVGSLCINFDITELKMAETAISAITNGNKPVQELQEQEVITNDIDRMLNSLIQQSIEYVGIPVIHMSREDKIKGLIFLKRKGAFFIKRSAERASKMYDISKNTLYNYLEEAKKNGLD